MSNNLSHHSVPFVVPTTVLPNDEIGIMNCELKNSLALNTQHSELAGVIYEYLSDK